MKENSDNNKEKVKLKSKFVPPIIYKEHAISHLCEEIRQLAPLALLNTDRFESGVGDFRWK